MIALVAMLAIAGPPEQSLDRAQIEAAKLRQLLEVERCATIAPCPRQHACPACEACLSCPTCPEPEPCIIAAPVVQPPSKAIRYLFAAGGVVVGALVVGIIWSASP